MPTAVPEKDEPPIPPFVETAPPESEFPTAAPTVRHRFRVRFVPPSGTGCSAASPSFRWTSGLVSGRAAAAATGAAGVEVAAALAAEPVPTAGDDCEAAAAGG